MDLCSKLGAFAHVLVFKKNIYIYIYIFEIFKNHVSCCILGAFAHGSFFKKITIIIFLEKIIITKISKKSCIRFKLGVFDSTSFKKNKNTDHASLGLRVRLREDLLDPPLEEPPLVFPS